MTTVVKSVQQVIDETEAHIKERGGPYSAWYAGVATDPEDRLFNHHNVSKANGFWLYRDCGTDTASRKVEAHFLAKGCKGGPGGGDSKSRYFYVYKITSSTKE